VRLAQGCSRFLYGGLKCRADCGIIGKKAICKVVRTKMDLPSISQQKRIYNMRKCRMSKEKRNENLRSQEINNKSLSIKGEIIALLVCVPFLLMGLAVIKIGIEQFLYQKAFTEETNGIIVSDVYTKMKKKGAGSGYRKVFSADYSYEHNGITYTDNIESANILKKGQVLTIRYKPDDPKENYVKGYESHDKVILIIVGTIWDAFLLLIVYCILISIKNKKCKKNITDHIE